VAFQNALPSREHNQGPEHPDTIAARGRLAHAYSSAGRPRRSRFVSKSSRPPTARHPDLKGDPAKTGNNRLGRTTITAWHLIRRVCR
jgi:hypothetical protein